MREPLYPLADAAGSFLGFHSQDEDITLRDFLLKSDAKIQTFHDIEKLNLAASEKVRIFASDFNSEINEALCSNSC